MGRLDVWFGRLKNEFCVIFLLSHFFDKGLVN